MTLALIDTFGFFFRSFYAMPKLSSPDGFPTGLLTGFLNFTNALMRSNEADYVLFCLEGKGQGFREKLYPDYKGQRPDAPEEFKIQLPIAIKWIEKMGFASISIDGYEADDVIATACKIAKTEGINVQIVSHDKDLYQLIDDGKVSVWDPTKKKHVNTAECFEKFGVYPKDFIDFQALIGDSVDNVPGIKGIGPKTASKLINDHGTLDAILNANISGRIGELIANGKDSANLSKELVTLKDDLFETLDFSKLKLPSTNILSNIADDLQKFNMRAAQKTKPEFKPKPSEANLCNAIMLDTKEKLCGVISQIMHNSIIALDTETDSLDSKNAKLVGFSFACSFDCAYYVPIAHNYLGVSEQISKQDAQYALKILLQHKIIAHNWKFDSVVLGNFLGFEPNAYFDTMIAAWLINPSELIGLDYLAKKHFNHTMISFGETVKKNDNFASVLLEEATKYAAEDAWMTYKLHHLFKGMLDKDLQEEFFNVEMPFIKILSTMENIGVKVDIAALNALKSKLTGIIEEKKQSIFELSKLEFNLNSPKQLQTVLFEELNLTASKKTRTGFSTDEATLSKMRGEHPIIDLILDYRELFKLQSTYILPLIELGSKNKDNRIYSSFLQTGTATGRLSSKNPNLQNIPARKNLAKELRTCFVAQNNKCLIGIDYSQIELRLLAHFSLDPTLLNAFNENKDIHMQTAIKIFGQEQAKEKRSFAKTINFGLLYGMGAQKLSDTLKISQKDAKELIESYFNGFPTVKNFIDSIKENVHQNGFVETLLKRKRYFNFSNANAREIAMFEREAVNTIFQGSAADLIKLAMNKIDMLIKTQHLKANMILQIHDELIFEVDEQYSKEYGKLFSDIMQNIHTLNVPLVAAPNYGKNWGELK